MDGRSVFPVLLGLLACATPPAAGADLLIGVEIGAGDWSCPTHVFGWRATASDLVDAWDVPEPPGSPGALLLAAFAMSHPSVPAPDRWRQDIRSPDAFLDGRETWLLVVDSLQEGVACTLVFTPQQPGAERHTVEVATPTAHGTVSTSGEFTFVPSLSRTIVSITLGYDQVRQAGVSWGGARGRYR